MLATSRLAYPIDDFASEIGVSRAYLYRLIKNGRGPRVTKIGRKSVIQTKHGIEWLAAHVAKSQEAA
jgi:predicted DNA-binding transcriptional regulator AlpA